MDRLFTIVVVLFGVAAIAAPAVYAAAALT